MRAVLVSFAVGLVAGYYAASNVGATRYAELERAHVEASARAVQVALVEQQRQYDKMQEVSDEGDRAVTAVRADVVGADASVRVRDAELAAVRAHARRELSAAATQRATDRQTILVLSELYERADERARELSSALDEAHARGLTCEAAYVTSCGAP